MSSKFNNVRANIKLCIVGDSGIGKTSFCNRYIKNEFRDDYQATINPTFSYKIFNYNNYNYKINIWDIAGQDRNIYISKVFTKDAHGILVLCDATNPNTIDKALKWKTTIDENSKFLDGSLLPAALVMNKMDLVNVEDQSYPKKENLEEVASSNNFVFSAQISCKTGDGVDDTMENLLRYIIDKYEEHMKNLGVNVEELKLRGSIVKLTEKSPETGALSTFQVNNLLSKCC